MNVEAYFVLRKSYVEKTNKNKQNKQNKQNNCIIVYKYTSRRRKYRSVQLETARSGNYRY